MKNAPVAATSPRLLNVDLIRVLAMFMVLVLHTWLNFTQRPDFFATKLWFLLEPSIAISKVGVVLFFILSGYLVIPKRRTITENWQKTLSKIIIPLAFFSVLNLIFAAAHFTYDPHLGQTFWQAQMVRVTGFPSSPLWFLVVLLFLYLLNPVWQLLFHQENKSVAEYVTYLAIGFALISTFLKFPAGRNLNFLNNFTSWTGYVGVYLYGGMLRQGWWAPKSRRLNLVLVGLGLLVSMGGDYLTVWSGIHQQVFTWSGYFFDYLSLPVLAVSFGLFNWLIYAKLVWPTWVEKLVVQLAKWSFGIYLIHPYVISILLDLGWDFNKVGINVYLYNLANLIIVFGISTVLTMIILQLPLIKRVLGEK